MHNERLATIVACMTSSNEIAKIQMVQTEHRIKLVEFWEIKEGDKVLEIGCGQGDTTAVLAYYVGKSGLVHGIDIGSPSYGAPITLGDSAEHLMKSKLGRQIKIDFEIDILAQNVDFPENSFDCIVLSHCSWYLKSFEMFIELLQKVKKWGKKLCFAEWDPRINIIEQYPHLLSILIQAQYESFKQNSDSNIRTLFTPNDCKQIAKNSGWAIINEESIFSPKLQDGEWEVGKVLTDLEGELKKISNMPGKLEKLIHSETELLADFVNSREIKPLSVFAFVAR